MTDLEIDSELDRFEQLQAAATARQRAQAAAEEARRHAAEQAALRATQAEAKERLRAVADEYFDLVRSLDVNPVNAAAWRDLHLRAVDGNRLIRRLTGGAGYDFPSPVGGGLIETLFRKWGMEMAAYAGSDRRDVQIRTVSEALRVDLVKQAVDALLAR